MKILVIRFTAIGDILLTLPICSTLKKSFPEAQVDYLVYANAEQVLRHHQDIDNLITISPEQRKNPIKYLKKIWTITRSGYDIIIDAQSTGKTELISLLSLRSKYRLGRYKKGRGFCYTHRIDEFKGHKIQQRLALLEPLKKAGMQIQAVSQFAIHLTDKEKQRAHANLLDNGVDPSKPIFAFSVSSKLSHRLWKAEYMKAVAKHCLDNHKAQIVFLTGMPHEQATIDNFKRELSDYEQVFANVSAPSLRDLAALLSQCHIYVGNEGGPRHIAEAVGIPSVAVFSPAAVSTHWKLGERDNHQSIEWCDVVSTGQVGVQLDFKEDPDYYQKMYYSIKPEHVIPLVDDVVAKSL